MRRWRSSGLAGPRSMSTVAIPSGVWGRSAGRSARPAMPIGASGGGADEARSNSSRAGCRAARTGTPLRWGLLQAVTGAKLREIDVALAVGVGLLVVTGCADVDGGDTATTERSMAEPAQEDSRQGDQR